MTNTEHLPTVLSADDPRYVIAQTVVTARATVDAVRPDQFSLPTPCTEYTVVDLLGHLLGVFGRIAAIGRSEDAIQVNTESPFAAVDDWSAAFEDAAHAIQAAWTDPATLDRTVVMPWATLPAPAMLAMYTNELTVHTWDLAHATGQTPSWYEPALGIAYTAMQVGLPADGRIAEIPFADIVTVREGAPLIDRLVAWNGRRP